MNSRYTSIGLGAILVGLVLLGTAGCQSKQEPEWLGAAPTGTISDLNRKLGGQRDGRTSAPPEAGRQAIVLLVVHDADGKPQYVEVQRGSGDPAKDRQAQDYVMKQRRFAKGAANTVTVTVDPNRLPKP